MSAKKILVPVSLTEGSRAAVAVATRLAFDLGATMLLLHVMPPNGVLNASEAERSLQQLAARFGAQIRTEFSVCTGRPSEKIVETADTLRPDAIVMSTHGYRGWFTWSHRHTAREVRQRVNCPVWLVSPGNQNEVITLSMFAHCVTTLSIPQLCSHEKVAPFPTPILALRPPA